MLLWISVALAQDCQHTPLVEVRAAEWASTSDAHRQLAREKRRQGLELVNEARAPGGEAKAERMLRVADLYIEEGIDRHLSGDESAAWFAKSLKLTTSILKSYPTYERAWHAEASAIEALTWLGRHEEALAMKPDDDHVRADLLWALGRLDEACALHPEDDAPAEVQAIVAEFLAVQAILREPLVAQIAWLHENPQNPYATALRDRWMNSDARPGLIAWFELFPLDDAQERLTPAQRQALSAEPDVHTETPDACAPYTAAAARCLNGDASLAEPLTDSEGLVACLDVEVWLRSRPADAACEVTE